MTDEEIGNYVRSLLKVIPAYRDEYYAEEFAVYELRRNSGARSSENRTYHRLAMRDGERCRVPGCTNNTLQIDHIIPRSAGGSDALENLQLLCSGHNQSKGVKDWVAYVGQLWTQFRKQHVDQHQTLKEWERLGYRMEDYQ